jgi:phosphatidylethanolamine-binding protein (PEBP) family uncharacterized protein
LTLNSTTKVHFSVEGTPTKSGTLIIKQIMYIPAFIEYGLGQLLYTARGRDAKLFHKGPAFANFPEPTLTIESPDVGPSCSNLSIIHTQFGEERFPELRWSAASPEIKEYILISEDPDAPLPTPITHGLYYAIPATITGVTAKDIEPASELGFLKGGFKYSKNRRGNVYNGPRPPYGHGPHRYWFTLIGLKEPVDSKKLGVWPTKEELELHIQDKVAGWGSWVGVYERKWE